MLHSNAPPSSMTAATARLTSYWREWDQATELYHYRARQYDPETGRFLQEDPIGFVIVPMSEALEYVERATLEGRIGSSRSYSAFGSYPNSNISLYRYVENNPLSYVDYSGEIPSLAGIRNNAISLAKSLRFQAQKRLNILPRAKNTPNSLRNTNNGQFTGNAAAQEFRRAKTMEAIGKCLNDIGAGFQVFGDTDKGLQISTPSGASLGQVLASRLCAAAGLVAGYGAKKYS